MKRSLALATLVTSIACSTAAAVTSVHYHGLRSVRVTVSNGSLPPPSGAPHTTSFVPGHGLAKAQTALNANAITRLATPRANEGCAGGYNATIKIVKQDNSVLKMTGYRCGHTTSGRIGGNLPGFLKAVGISPP